MSDQDNKNADSRQLRVLSYNVLHNCSDWLPFVGALTESKTRYAAIIRLLEEAIAEDDRGFDVIGLMEVVPLFLDEYVVPFAAKNKYHIHRAWSLEYHFCILLSKLPFEYTESVPLFKTNKMVAMGTVRLPSGSKLGIACCHFSHLDSNHAIRKEQLKRLTTWLDESKELADAATHLVMGDLNFHNTFEDEFIDTATTVDVWAHLRPDDDGYTYDSHTNSLIKRLRLGGLLEKRRMRLDRMLLYNSKTTNHNAAIRPAKTTLFAANAIDKPDGLGCGACCVYPLYRLPLFCSDHFGIDTTFTIQSNE